MKFKMLLWCLFHPRELYNVLISVVWIGFWHTVATQSTTKELQANMDENRWYSYAQAEIRHALNTITYLFPFDAPEEELSRIDYGEGN